LRGRVQKVLHYRQFTNIKQYRYIDRLKISFGIIGDIFYSYAELKLFVKNRENVNYIDKAQIVYNDIIESEKREFLIEMFRCCQN